MTFARIRGKSRRVAERWRVGAREATFVAAIKRAKQAVDGGGLK
jgi:hypothetical protein